MFSEVWETTDMGTTETYIYNDSKSREEAGMLEEMIKSPTSRDPFPRPTEGGLPLENMVSLQRGPPRVTIEGYRHERPLADTHLHVKNESIFFY